MDPKDGCPETFPGDDLSRLVALLRRTRDGAFAERTWDVHGVGLRLAADHARIVTCAERLLGVFPPLRQAGRPRLRLALTVRQRWDIPGDAVFLPPSSHEIVDAQAAYGVAPRFARRERLNYYSFAPMGCAAYDLDRGLCVGGLADPAAYRPWLMEHLVLQMLLLELLRGQGLFWLHAGCVARDGKAVVFAGHTGSGKTTTCLNLAINGFDFLAEDRCFVRAAGGRVAVLGYPRDTAVTPESLALLPALRERVGAATFSARKLRLPAAALFPNVSAATAAPCLVLFPRVTGEARTSFRRLPPQQALCRLLPNSLLASQPGVSARHFEALASLVRSARTYDLELGRDVAALPQMIADLMDAGDAP